jgi:23S rRNA (uracil1939-C5)-methyltransferase
VDFTLTPGSFLQVNEAVATQIYKAVCDSILATDPDTVVDAYCGIGITSVLFSRSAKKVVGIEISPQAVRDAKRLASQNNAKNVTFLCGDCKALLPTVKTQGKTVFFVDPPRAGLDAGVIRAIKRFAPTHLVYLSCDPETLARDLRSLCPHYTVTSATPYDMFPNAEHVETLVCLERM